MLPQGAVVRYVRSTKKPMLDSSGSDPARSVPEGHVINSGGEVVEEGDCPTTDEDSEMDRDSGLGKVCLGNIYFYLCAPPLYQNKASANAKMTSFHLLFYILKYDVYFIKIRISHGHTIF